MMSHPTSRLREMLKRIVKHSKGKPRLIWRYGWPDPVETIDITSDANFGSVSSRQEVDIRRNDNAGIAPHPHLLQDAGHDRQKLRRVGTICPRPRFGEGAWHL